MLRWATWPEASERLDASLALPRPPFVCPCAARRAGVRRFGQKKTP